MSPVRGPDAITVLTVFLCLLWLIQAKWIVGPLGGVGTPALLVGLAAAAWRIAGAFDPRLGFASGFQPVRTVLLVQAWYFALTFGLARLRPLTELEANGSTRGMITLVALTGIALLAVDGVPTRARLDLLLRRLVVLASIAAVVGILQFVVNVDLVGRIRWPLLSTNGELGSLGTRSQFARPYGTALHPIEFGAVLAMVLPLAVHYFLTSPSRKARIRFGVASGLLGLGIAMSMSRTGLLGAAVAIAMLVPLWSQRLRLNAAIIGVGAVAVTWVAIPGLVGTIKNLFLRAGDDPSVEARINRIPWVADMLAESPWYGRGYGVFSVEEYRLLDNEVFELLIETGFLGVLIMLTTFGVAVGTARGVRYRGRDAATRHLGQAVAASVVAGALATATFSAFFYRIYAGMAFLLVGCAGALWRLEGRPSWAEGFSLRRPAATVSRGGSASG
jgi:polysaccharide biosynthesis protein PslJ